MPLQGVNGDVKEVLGVASVCEACSRRGGHAVDSEDHGHGADLVGGLILRHADQVFVKVLRRLCVLRDAVVVLVQGATKGNELKELEDELVLVLALLEFFVILVFLKKKTST